MDIGFLFNEIFVRPITTALVAIYQLLSLLHVPYALGFSIILLTILIRFILYPLTTSSLKASKKMQTLSPHLSRLKEKHKGDSARLQQETMKLYKEHGVNPAAGCLPSLAQMPMVWALYTVLQKIVALKPDAVVSEINKLIFNIGSLKLTSSWDHYFFGIPLGQNPSNLIGSAPLIILIPVLTGVLQFIQSKMIMSPSPRSGIIEKKDKKDDKKSSHEDFATAFQTQSLFIFPAMIGFFSYSFPIGLSLYWNTYTIFAILQQYQVQGLGGLEGWKDKVLGYIKKDYERGKK